jgi:hypothetical protein
MDGEAGFGCFGHGGLSCGAAGEGRDSQFGDAFPAKGLRKR